MTTHRYLFDEHVHSFYPTLATRIGLNEAVVLQQIHSWIQTYTKDPKQFTAKHWHDGRWWIWNSYPEWHEKLPYLSESTIRRALVHMRKLGILKVGNYNTLKIDRTYWYAIDYAAYDALMADQDTKTDAPSYQNEQMQDTNLVSPLPSISPSTSASKEPPPADSPVEDSQDDEPEIAETAAMFKTPTASQEAPEQRIERLRDELGTDPLQVAAVVERNRAGVDHPDGGDASRDGDPWMNRPVKEWCAFIRIPYENSRVAYFATELSHIAVEVHASAEQTGEAIRKMALSPSCEWLRTAHDPKHTGFAGTLLNVLNGQELPEGKPNDGARGGRAPEPVPAFTFVDPDWLGVST